jgi:hypothetical protein
VAAYKPDAARLDQFIKRKGGINACAALGRGAASTTPQSRG